MWLSRDHSGSRGQKHSIFKMVGKTKKKAARKMEKGEREEE